MNKFMNQILGQVVGYGIFYQCMNMEATDKFKWFQGPQSIDSSEDIRIDKDCCCMSIPSQTLVSRVVKIVALELSFYQGSILSSVPDGHVIWIDQLFESEIDKMVCIKYPLIIS